MTYINTPISVGREAFVIQFTYFAVFLISRAFLKHCNRLNCQKLFTTSQDNIAPDQIVESRSKSITQLFIDKYVHVYTLLTLISVITHYLIVSYFRFQQSSTNVTPQMVSATTSVPTKMAPIPSGDYVTQTLSHSCGPSRRCKCSKVPLQDSQWQKTQQKVMPVHSLDQVRGKLVTWCFVHCHNVWFYRVQRISIFENLGPFATLRFTPD